MPTDTEDVVEFVVGILHPTHCTRCRMGWSCGGPEEQDVIEAQDIVDRLREAGYLRGCEAAND